MNYDAFPSLQFTRQFTIEIQAYCTPTSVTANLQFTPVTLNYIVGDPTVAVSSILLNWTTVPEICNIIYIIHASPMPAAGNPLISFFSDADSADFFVQTDELYYNNDSANYNPGHYILELHAYSDNGTPDGI